MTRLLSRLSLAALALAAFATAAPAAPARCNEDCLLGIASSYMDSLSGNDPAGAPFAAKVRTTENGKDTPLTAGVWKSARGWLYRHTFVDPVTGEIGAFGVVREDADQDAMLSLRLRVVDRQIVESEILTARRGDFSLFEPRAATEAKPIFKSFVPANRRSTRAQLAAIPGKYFEAIAKGDPNLIPTHPDANRFENGVQTTNGTRLPQSTSVTEGLQRLIYMQRYREVRVPVIDVERGLVFAIVAFDMPEMNRTLTIRGKPVEISNQRNRLPRTLFLYELFKVESGRVVAIEAIMRDAPLGATMGWAK